MWRTRRAWWKPGVGAGARGLPDGRTITVVSTSFLVNPSLYPKIPYDPCKDFARVALAAISPNVLTIHPAIPANNVKELVAFLKANQGSTVSPTLARAPHRNFLAECSNGRKISILWAWLSTVQLRRSSPRLAATHQSPSHTSGCSDKGRTAACSSGHYAEALTRSSGGGNVGRGRLAGSRG